jgi:3-(3-hydroxy-phenyl)propionate hydroxylase
VLLHFGPVEESARRAVDALGLVLIVLHGAAEPNTVPVRDTHGLAARRYDARPGSCYLIRPDQHVAARWRRFDAETVRAALARATGH